jgi:predicted ATP-dependent endonuclease of OLD family
MNANCIKKVEINGLFHKYNMKWELKPDVNILVGINGIGKTTILRSMDALLSKKYTYLKNLEIDVEATLSDNTVFAYSGTSKITKNPQLHIDHEYITTFDVPLKDKKTISQAETPLDKELQSIIYTIGKNQKSFSNYRFKATNYPDEAEKINSKIKHLFEMIDKMFAETRKKIEINPKDNSLFFRQDDTVISLEQLSSGEKQLLIILFTVFLMEEKPSILLMDEPEISLHIGWQQQLIDVIRKLNPDCQLIIATHSPSIFGDGWGDKLFFVEDLLEK